MSLLATSPLGLNLLHDQLLLPLEITVTRLYRSEASTLCQWENAEKADNVKGLEISHLLRGSCREHSFLSW